CTLRRMILTLRALAWLDHALNQQWRLVRPADLPCVAYNAIKTQGPRRLVGLTHRSQDVKTRLKQTPFSRSPFSAVDATYVPQWETNIGMIWGLFAVTPVIVRMKTSTYLDSDWCHRESELLDFIVECCDFVRGRQFIDATLDQIETLDQLLPAASALNAQAQAAQFPGQRQVLVPPRLT